jgi:hypothetical protein
MIYLLIISFFLLNKYLLQIFSFNIIFKWSLYIKIIIWTILNKKNKYKKLISKNENYFLICIFINLNLHSFSSFFKN